MATYVITIDGNARTLKPGWSVTESANSRNTFSGGIQSEDGTYRPALGDEIVLTEDAVTIFGGYVDAITEGSLGDNSKSAAIVSALTAVDYNSLADRRQVSGDFASQTLKTTVTSLVDDYLADYGVTLSGSQADGPVLAALSYRGRTLTDVFNELASLSADNGWTWNIDYDKVLQFTEISLAGNPAPFNITDGDGNVIGDMLSSPTQSDYANRIIVLFSASATTAYAFLNAEAGNFANNETVTLGSQTYTMKSPFVDAANNVAIGADGDESLNNLVAAITGGAGAGAVYGTGTSVNGSATAYMHHTAFMAARALTPGSGGNSTPVGAVSVNVFWHTEGGIPVTTLTLGSDESVTNFAIAEDAADQALHGIWERSYEYPDVFDYSVALAIAESLLARSTATQQEVRYTTLQTGIHPGMAQTITATKRDLTGTFVVTDVVVQHEAGRDVAPRNVTTWGGTNVPDRWQDDARRLFNGGSSSGAASNVTVSTGGNVSGSGTENYLARWTSSTSSVLGDSIVSQSGAALTVTGSLNVTSDFSVATNKFTVASASGNTVVAGTLGVTGNVAVNTNKFTVTSASGNTLVAGTLDATGNFAVNTNKFTVAAASGNTVVAGTLGVTGNATFSAQVGIGTSPSYPLHIVGGVGYLWQAIGVNGAAIRAITDSQGRVAIETRGEQGAGTTGGAYFICDGYEETFFAVTTRSNGADRKNMRFGNRAELFVVQLVNDAGNTVIGQPMTVANIAPTDSFYITTAGDVVFGTSSSGSQHVRIYDTSNLERGLLVENTSTGNAGGATVRLICGANSSALTQYSSGHATRANQFLLIGTNSLVLATNGSDRITITSAGAVTVAQTLAVTGNFSVGSTVTVTAASGNIVTSGTIKSGGVASAANFRFLAAEAITAHAHYGFLDVSTISNPAPGLFGHASVNVAVVISGSEDIDHHHAFQDTSTYSGSGTLSVMAGVYVNQIVTAGTITEVNGLRYLNPSVSGGTLTEVAAVRVFDLTAGVTNYSLRSTGAAVILANAGPAVLSSTLAVTGAADFSSTITTTQALAANTSGDGFIATNTTAATSGNQRFSPRMRWTGQGWKTDATAASQTVDAVMELRPVQGAAAPSGQFTLLGQVNGGGYTNLFALAYAIGTSTVLTLNQPTAGTAAFTRLAFANDLGSRGFFTLLSSTFTSSGINTADGIALVSTGTGGATFGATNAAGTCRLYALNIQQLNLGAVTTQRLGGAGTGFNIVESINTTAGTANGARISCVTDAGANRFAFSGFSTTWTVLDSVNLADAMTVFSAGVGGLTVAATDASGGNVRIIARGTAATNIVATFGANQNILIGAATAPSSGANGLVFPDGTAFATMGSNTAGLYADDVSGTVALFAINENDETARLTPGGIPTPRDLAPGSFTVQTGRYIVTVDLSLGASDVATLDGTAVWKVV